MAVRWRRSIRDLERLARALQSLQVTLRNAPTDLRFTLDSRALALGCNYTFDTNIGEKLDVLGYVEPIGTYEDLLPRPEQQRQDRTAAIHLKAIKQVRHKRRTGER